MLFVLLYLTFNCVTATHFRGGIITWRAWSTTPSGTTASILIHQRFSWRRNYWGIPSECTSSTIATQGLVGSSTGLLTCTFGTDCVSFADINSDVKCTDYSSQGNWASGERYDNHTLKLNNSYIVNFNGGNWMLLAIGGNGLWDVTGKIDLTVRPDGIINTSPVTTTLPVIYRAINVQHVHIVPMSDADSTDTLRCRWATDNTVGYSNTNGYNECSSVCSPSLPAGFQLFSDNCTLVFTLTATDYYSVALQIEDYYTSTSLTPMSSVPIQFLFLGITSPAGCSTPPTIIGVRPNLACIGTPIGSLTNETVIAQVNCPGKQIVDFTTSSPIGMTKTAIYTTGINLYAINLLWIPTSDQYGPQGFCAGAIDDSNVQSDPWCITFLVGFTAPDLQTPLLVQGSASPVGTVFSNQSIFSIQSVNGKYVNRPTRNGTYIKFNDKTLNSTTVLSYDCGWSPNIIYSKDTLIIYAPYSWIPGHTYYITFDSGASSGTDFCHAESAPISNPDFWVFDIWNPGMSSTTTTTTTPPTTHTVSTRGPSTTTPIANLTTTGIVVTTVLTTTTTSETTTTTSSSSTTTTTTVSTTESTTPTNIISAADFERICRQPVAIMTAVTMITMIPINIIGMFTLFTKLSDVFDPRKLEAQQRWIYSLNRRFGAK